MNRIYFAPIVVVMLAIGVVAQTAPDAAQLTSLLKEFLAGASRNDAAIHDRFWSDDLIYTGSSGRRIGKTDIMRDTRSAPPPKPADPRTTYSAEDIRIQLYGDTAVVAFRLVGAVDRGGKTEVTKYLNTGTFLKRHGGWQAISWQATRVPRAEEEIRNDVAAAEAAFHQAVLFADVKKLELLTDDTFIWTHRTGEQTQRQQLLDDLASGRLRYSKLDTTNVKIQVYGDSAVVRGVSPRQRSAIPGSPGSGDASPFNASFTLTLVNKGGGWKAVAMHSSGPN
ncbi:MAG: nuclear transport factor 2 family protein [Blastocatellia bacterium]